MRSLLASLSFALVIATAPAQAIVASTTGIPDPARVVDFGANVLPNFAAVTNQFLPAVLVTNASYFTTTSSPVVPGSGVPVGLGGGFLTRLPMPTSSTLSLQFAAPVTDASFVYHQVGTSSPSTIRALLAGTVVDSFSGTWTQYQPNNVFGFTNLVFDEIQIDYVIDFNLDNLAFNPVGAARCPSFNGSGVNLAGFLCTALPVLGTTWQGTVATTPNTLLTLLAYAPLGIGTPIPVFGGELLLQPSAGDVLFPGTGSYSLPIPNSSSWTGVQFTFQAVRIDSIGGVPTIVPMNARTLVLGT